MPNYPFPFAVLLLCAALLSCSPDKERQLLAEQQRQDSIRTVALRDSVRQDSVARATAEKERAKTVNQALKDDAQLARKMSLEKFSEYMKTRERYYSRYKEFSYEDEFVKIKKDGDKLKIETPTGKAKFEDGESKIKTDTYKRKTETE